MGPKSLRLSYTNLRIKMVKEDILKDFGKIYSVKCEAKYNFVEKRKNVIRRYYLIILLHRIKNVYVVVNTITQKSRHVIAPHIKHDTMLCVYSFRTL
jgi:hypothetical protein